MKFTRSAALIAALGLSFIAAGCSNGGGGATPPLPVTAGPDAGAQTGAADDGSAVNSAPVAPDSTADSSTATTMSTTATTTGVPRHIMTATIFWGYGGTPTSVSLSSAAPYMSWAQTGSSYTSTLQSHGVKVDRYMNFWRNYSTDYNKALYNDIKPGGAHAPAESKTCSGSVEYDKNYGGGYETDARSSYALGHAKLAGGLNGANAAFSDDTGAVYGMVPCGFSVSTYQTAVNRVDSGLGYAMFLNVLGAGLGGPTSVQGQVPYTLPSNVIGAMCESCYTHNGSSDGPVLGTAWTDTENAEIKMVSLHKIFWDYARAAGPYTEYKLRRYALASLLLSYSPNYAMLQEILQTPSKFAVFPETGVVPMYPVTTASSVGGYARSGGAYMRQFGACYYRGVNKGKCAVIVNPQGVTVPVPTTAYGHRMVISGAGVLDGGSVSFSGSRPSSIASGDGEILFP